MQLNVKAADPQLAPLVGAAAGAPDHGFADALFGEGASGEPFEADDNADVGQIDPPFGELRFLDLSDTAIEDCGQGVLRVRCGETAHEGVHAVRAFPASHPWEFISLRYREGSGRERELGMIRALGECPEAAREAVRRSLGRRYLLRRIREIKQVHTDRLGLVFFVLTDAGPARFLLDRPAENARPFGRHGLLLLDRGGNYYVIPDRKALPQRQQSLLELYCAE